VITDTHYQGKKINPQVHVSDAKRLWDEVVRQVTDQGLMLGISAALPAAVTPTTSIAALKP
jgi:hypothetical protein